MAYTFTWRDDTESFYFETHLGLSYSISFIEDYHLNYGYGEYEIDDVSQLIISKKGTTKGNDIKVALTIQRIIINFFRAKRDNALVYTCDNSDGRQFTRFVLFDKWFNNCGLTDYIKVDNVLKSGEKMIYTSLILHKRNTHYDLILERYQRIEQNFK